MGMVEARTFRRGGPAVEEDQSPVLFWVSLRGRLVMGVNRQTPGPLVNGLCDKAPKH